VREGLHDKIYKYIKYIINQKKEREEERERKYLTDYIVLRLVNKEYYRGLYL
jgi:hypothetical protein